MAVLLEMRKICKEFPGVRANYNCDLTLEQGEVHALLGENGAGKSTLMNVLYGLYKPTSGEIYWKGKKVDIENPKDAIHLGIGMVHQHFMLIPALTVIENVILGTKTSSSGVLDLESAKRKFIELADTYNMHIDPMTEVWQLSVGQQQRLEILKALYKGADLLILDEPTAVLTPQEAEELFTMIRKLTSQGHTVIFISHKLNEVLAICDNITVLRLGEAVATLEVGGVTKEELAQHMLGREIQTKFDKTSTLAGKVVLDLKDVETLNDKGLLALKKLSLSIRAGEILGIAGVDGNGQSELVEAITGLRKVTNGKVLMNGEEITNKTPRDILEHKVGHIPEDRHKRGVCLPMTLVENIMLMNYYRPPYAKNIMLDWKTICLNAKTIIEQYSVKAPNYNEAIQNLSGGNQQKVVLGREISRNPDLLIAMHPVRGLDIGASEFVYKQLLKQREENKAILLISGELEEVISLSDRIAVMYEGEIMGIVDAKNASIKELGLMMAGSHRMAI